jgi:replicative DNA helicase
MDYNELVITDYSEPTVASAFVAQKMREIAQRMDIACLSLFQPSKMAGSPADELTSYRAAKGSSAIEQSVSVMLGLSRPGYNPKDPDNDRYATLSCLKNRMGPTFSLDFHWTGLTGSVRNLTEEEQSDLKKLRENIAMQKDKGKGDWM